MRIEWVDDNGSEGAIEFDAMVLGTHAMTSVITDHNVEKGAAITDHVRPNAPRFTSEAVVSNSPVRQPSTQMGGVTGEVQAQELEYTRNDGTKGRTSVRILKWSGAFNRVQSVFDLIYQLWQSSTQLTVVAGLKTYENMVFSNVSIPENEFDAIRFTFEVAHLTLVEAKTTTDPVPRTRRKKKGKKTPTQTDDKNNKVSRSVLRNLAAQTGALPAGAR